MNLEADAALAWQQWADQREQETTFRRDSGRPCIMPRDEFLFTEGFKAGVLQEVMRRAHEETKEIREREREGEFVGQDVMDFHMR